MCLPSSSYTYVDVPFAFIVGVVARMSLSGLHSFWLIYICRRIIIGVIYLASLYCTPSIPNYLSVLIGIQILRNL
jgi:hypothetical protein